MTKEELEKEAEEYLENKHCKNVCIRDEIEECKQGIRIRCTAFDYRKKLIVTFAEPREKRIAELEKACEETQELLDKQIEATYRLDKENAELKKKVENLQKYLDSRNCYRECAETWLKLTEAKKLLKQFLEAKNGEDTYKAEWEAEQFLKDSEVEKCGQ